jgi:hypothetical protein
MLGFSWSMHGSNIDTFSAFRSACCPNHLSPNACAFFSYCLSSLWSNLGHARASHGIRIVAWHHVMGTRFKVYICPRQHLIGKSTGYSEANVSMLGAESLSSLGSVAMASMSGKLSLTFSSKGLVQPSVGTTGVSWVPTCRVSRSTEALGELPIPSRAWGNFGFPYLGDP